MRKSVYGQSAVAKADIAVISTDLDGNVTVFNHSAERLLGYPPEEIIGQAAPIQTFSKLKDAIHFTHPQASTEDFIHKNGDLIGMEVIFAPIKNTGGDTTGLLVTATRTNNADKAFNLDDLPNKTIFDVVLEREIRRMQREQKPISVLQLDVDHYKSMLQHYGEEKTEELLTQAAQLLDERIQRAGDMLSYTCFDEFLVILPNTDRSGTVKVAEQLRLLIQNAGIENKASKTRDTLTVSIGIANLIPDRETTAEQVLEMAQEQLKQAKADGRNCSRIGE